MRERVRIDLGRIAGANDHRKEFRHTGPHSAWGVLSDDEASNKLCCTPIQRQTNFSTNTHLTDTRPVIGSQSISQEGRDGGGNNTQRVSDSLTVTEHSM